MRFSLDLFTNMSLLSFVRHALRFFISRKHMQTRREPTYENQLESIAGQVARTIQGGYSDYFLYHIYYSIRTIIMLPGRLLKYLAKYHFSHHLHIAV